MSGSAATSDLVKFALTALQTGAARNAQQSVKFLVRFALMQTVAPLRIVAALGCALGALWTDVAPILGAAGALLAGAGVLGVMALLRSAWRSAPEKRARGRPPSVPKGTPRSPRRRAYSSSMRVWPWSPPCSPACSPAASVRRRWGKPRRRDCRLSAT